MPSFFGRKKPTPPTDPSAIADEPASPFSSLPHRSLSSPSPAANLHRKSPGHLVRERDKDKQSQSPRSSKSYSRPASRRLSADSHPLNLPYDELRRLSAARMSPPSSKSSSPAPAPNRAPPAGEPMETTPAPEVPPPASNGEDQVMEDRPAPPPHRTPTSPPPQKQPRPEDAEAFKAEGNRFYKAGSYGRAIDEYTKAIEADPSQPTYLSNRAAAYMAANRFVEALDDCKTADEKDPDNAKILQRLAKVYAALGRPGEALSVFDRIQPPATDKDRGPALAMQHHIAQAQDSLKGASSSGSMIL